MERRFKKAIAIISLILISLGLFLIFRTYIVLTDFKRQDNSAPIEQKLPLSFPVSYSTSETKKVIKDNRLIIPVIDVNLQVGTEQRFLDFGGWIVKTDVNNMPIAIAIHRFGLNDLTNDERIHQTLLHVDQLKVNDVITLDWEGEEYLYKVKSINIYTNNPPIGDKQLLLYTCEYWFSPERIFVLLTRFS